MSWENNEDVPASLHAATAAAAAAAPPHEKHLFHAAAALTSMKFGVQCPELTVC